MRQHPVLLTLSPRPALSCILAPVDTLSGSLERITYYNPENGYTILRLRPDRARGIPDLSRDGLATAGQLSLVPKSVTTRILVR